MSRQFEHLQQKSLQTLQAFASGLKVERAEKGFAVRTLNGVVLMEGRYQVVMAYLSGYRFGTLAMGAFEK